MKTGGLRWKWNFTPPKKSRYERPFENLAAAMDVLHHAGVVRRAILCARRRHLLENSHVLHRPDAGFPDCVLASAGGFHEKTSLRTDYAIRRRKGTRTHGEAERMGARNIDFILQFVFCLVKLLHVNLRAVTVSGDFFCHPPPHGMA